MTPEQPIILTLARLAPYMGCLVDPTDVQAIADNLIQILQRTYPNPLLFQPQILRQQTIARFEFTQFRQTLAGFIQQ